MPDEPEFEIWSRVAGKNNTDPLRPGCIRSRQQFPFLVDVDFFVKKTEESLNLGALPRGVAVNPRDAFMKLVAASEVE